MEKTFKDIVQIARHRTRQFPERLNEDINVASKRYTQGLIDEVKEVEDEVMEKNEVYLVDELSDIAWDYAMLLSLLEARGLIPSVEEVIEHGYQKYTERIVSVSQEEWEDVKLAQKQELDIRHNRKYKNL